jgi:RNA recognition motif-containing protein
LVHPALEHPHNYEESIRKLEHTQPALTQKNLLKKYSL